MNRNHMQCFFAPADMSKDYPASSQNGFRTNYRNGKMDQLRLDLVKGDVKGVETALNEGVAADHVLRGDWDLLMYASSLGHSDIVRLLLKKGCQSKFL
ncbi:hypothetical protein R5R35_014116 [Gryllus longicercus]|uniref:Uncharacterized protein n=1 Tax=Gryllus longicercus TaxID=2509291 RepID=A0AAN9V5L7_9ORTH